MNSLPALAFIGNLAGPDMLILGMIALLIFGRRLPEVGKNLGKTIVEFKKGLNGDPTAEQEEEVEEQAPAKRPVARLAASSATRPAKNLPTTEEV